MRCKMLMSFCYTCWMVCMRTVTVLSPSHTSRLQTLLAALMQWVMCAFYTSYSHIHILFHSSLQPPNNNSEALLPLEPLPKQVTTADETPVFLYLTVSPFSVTPFSPSHPPLSHELFQSLSSKLIVTSGLSV